MKAYFNGFILSTLIIFLAAMLDGKNLPPKSSQLPPSKNQYLRLKQARETLKDSFAMHRREISDQVEKLFEVERKELEMQRLNEEIAKEKRRVQYSAMLLSLVAALLLLTLYFYRQRKKTSHVLQQKDQKIQDQMVKEQTQDGLGTQNEPLPDPKIQELFFSIEETIKTQKLYTDPTLSLSSLADILQSNPNYVSRAINLMTKMNFNQYINEERIKEAQRLIYMRKSEAHLPDIWEECGFVSRSTFYTAFQKFSGMTPVEFKKKTLL
jgi:AraC-like DNA-binding protein